MRSGVFRVSFCGNDGANGAVLCVAMEDVLAVGGMGMGAGGEVE